MSLIADGILVVTCLTAAVYCYVLSVRLRRLSNTNEGIGHQIAQLNAAVEETRAANDELRSAAKAASERLAKESAQARKIAAALAKKSAEAEALLGRAYDAAPAETPPSPAPQPEPAARMPDPVPVPAAAAVVADEAAPEPAGEDFGDDISEAPLEAALDDPLGEQQLGFLPDIDDETDDDDALDESSALKQELRVDTAPDAAVTAAEQNGDPSVMTAERVAL